MFSALDLVKKEKAITAGGSYWLRRPRYGLRYEASLDFYQAAAKEVNNCRLVPYRAHVPPDLLCLRPFQNGKRVDNRSEMFNQCPQEKNHDSRE